PHRGDQVIHIQLVFSELERRPGPIWLEGLTQRIARAGRGELDIADKRAPHGLDCCRQNGIRALGRGTCDCQGDNDGHRRDELSSSHKIQPPGTEKYAVHRPAMMIAIHSVIDTKPTIRARGGSAAVPSQSATAGYTRAWKYQTFSPVSASITSFRRNARV